MSNLSKARAVANEWVDLMGGLDNISYIYGDDIGILVQAIHAAGLLMPDVQIVRTMEELEALDPDTALTLYTWKEASIWEASYLQRGNGDVPDLPATVIATGSQVRAAREAMEEEHE